jgi:pimeloyl-ACP methyl ester carboxylesterase
MAEPTLHHIVCPDEQGAHRMAYWQWGQGQHVVLCVHGLTRQGRDFDVLAQALCAQGGPGLRVICPDVVGRGQSDHLQDPSAYHVGTYAADMRTLLASLPVRQLDWVGTSMGGLIALWVAGAAPISVAPAGAVAVRRLVLNDVGPQLAWPAMQRLISRLGQAAVFSSLEQGAAALWAISSSFGPHTAAQWLALSRPMFKETKAGSGRYQWHYDLAIAQPFKAMTAQSFARGEAALWSLYDRISARTLLLRGAQSDLLSLVAARAMTERGPKARLIEFAGVGHAPMLVVDDQVQAVVSFLLD